jgi:hypothetical protein
VERDGEGTLVLLFFGSEAWTRGGARGKRRKRELGMAATRSGTRCPHRHFPEQLVGHEVAGLEHVYGLFPLGFGPCSKKQSCCPQVLLQDLLRMFGY